MKKIILLSFICVNVLIQAQSQTPAKAKQTFKKKYTTATEVEWDYDEDNSYYIAQFIMYGKEKQALFDESGNWAETRTVYEERELPLAVRNTLNEKYSEFHYNSSELINTLDETYFEIIISFKEEDSYIIKIAKSGEFLEAKQIYDDQEEGDH